MMLIVTARGPLERAYGNDGYSQIRAALDDFALAAEARVVALDDSTEMAESKLPPVVNPDAGSVLLSIRALRRVATESVTSLLLVGGHEVLPFWQISNPVIDRNVDPDPIVNSDNPYGTQTDTLEEYLAPTLPVGRLANPEPRSAKAFVEVVALATLNRQSRPSRFGSMVLVNQQWADVSRQASTSLHDPIGWHLSPGYVIDSATMDDTNRECLYFNLHGFSGVAAWKGYDPIRGQYITAVTPGSFDRQFVRGSVVFAENCYGAEIAGRAAGTSCALRLSREGAAVIGATGLAFGSHLVPHMFLEDADCLARRFFSRWCAERQELGVALQGARADYFAETATSVTDPFKQKTLLQFILLGDPGWN